ncbi:hypothetical protein Nepgr_023940 [Nepenthes gracilis]|uniref:Uncharacterized protein n=1 Tax=Nepenthes gracilis TaxID=150966 RepID=A0AAD3T4W8_NEPGR|nr:hypothetical protein Nepgr_023940 [Nepenthes gracilis]
MLVHAYAIAGSLAMLDDEEAASVFGGVMWFVLGLKLLLMQTGLIMQNLLCCCIATLGYAFNLLHCCALLLGGGLAGDGDMRPVSGSDDGMMQHPGGVLEGS